MSLSSLKSTSGIKQMSTTPAKIRIDFDKNLADYHMLQKTWNSLSTLRGVIHRVKAKSKPEGMEACIAMLDCLPVALTSAHPQKAGLLQI